jgi:hypothetical protein
MAEYDSSISDTDPNLRRVAAAVAEAFALDGTIPE